MPKRPGDWHLLDCHEDPVIADVHAINDRVTHYREIADMMETEAQTLQKIANGESLRGKYADELRHSAGEVGGSLQKVVGRYRTVVTAMTEYVPHLETALTESLAVLDDAMAAYQLRGAADAMPTATPEKGKELTDEQRSANDDKQRAQHSAADHLAAAKARLGAVLATLNDTGRKAAATVRGGFNDGLTDSRGDRIRARFAKFLHILAKVLMWVGIAFAAIALLVPGLNVAIMTALGVALGAVTLAVAATLKAMKEGSTLEVVLAGVGLLTAGAGGALLKGAGAGARDAAGRVAPESTAPVAGAPSGGSVPKVPEPSPRPTGDGAYTPAPGSEGSVPPVNTSRPVSERICKADPVDVATGEVILTQTDVQLPLNLDRTHVSSYRAGRSFGASWASVLDERLEFDGDDVRYLAADGTILVYPRLTSGGHAMPASGPRWPLQVHPNGTADLHDPVEGRQAHFQRNGDVAFASVIVGAGGARLTIERDDQGTATFVRSSTGVELQVLSQDGRVTALHLLDTAQGPSALVVAYVYDDRGHLVRLVDGRGQTTRFDYDYAGRVVAWHDRNGFDYHYDYDVDGRCTATRGTDDVLSATFHYDQVSRTTVYHDSLGHEWTYRQDVSGRTEQETDPLGNVTWFVWNEYGHLLSRTDPLGRISRFSYHDEGRLILVEPDGSELRVWAPRPSGDQPPGWNGGREFRGVGEAASPAVSPVHNGRFRRGGYGLVSPGRALARRLTRDGEGNVIESVDAVGGTDRAEYGAFDRVTRTIDRSGARIGYEYDTELRLTAVTDPLERRWSYAYDAAGCLVQEVDYDGRTLEYAYDAAGQLTRAVNGLGEAVEYVYDALNRVVERRTEDERTLYAYDSQGRLAAARNIHATLVFERDDQGRVIAQTTNGQRVDFTYDEVNGRIRRRTAAGRESVWSFDASGRPLTLVEGEHELSFCHDEHGREVRRTLDGVAVLEQVFADGLLAAQVLPSRRENSFAYRADGELEERTDSVEGLTRFRLDDMGRVRAVDGPDRTEEYRYDEAGALVHALIAGDGLHTRRDFDAGDVHRRDPQGRVVERRVSDGPDGERSWRHEWDALDRLVGVTCPDGSRWRYLYDPLGRRQAKLHLAPGDGRLLARTDFVWDGPRLIEQVRVDADGDRQVTTWEYHPLSAYPLTQRGEDSGADDLVTLITDAVGTPTKVVTTAWVTAATAPAGVWGAPLDPAGGPSRTPLRFPGQYYDEETGLHYNIFRYYDPLTAGYLSQDPLGLLPAPNPVTYVSNPFRLADPLGLAPSGCVPGPSTAPVRPQSETDAAHQYGSSSSSSLGATNGVDGAAALSNYLGGGASSVNNFLRGTTVPGSADARSISANVDAITKELGHLPTFEGQTFRGIDFDLGAGLRRGDQFVDPGFFSTSMNRGQAEAFIFSGGKLNGANTSGRGTLFVVDSASGRNVTGRTGLGESEVLFPHGHTFEVAGVKTSLEQFRVNGQDIGVRVVYLKDPGMSLD